MLWLTSLRLTWSGLPARRLHGPPLGRLVFCNQQALQLFLEFAHVGEVAVDAGKADVGHRVDGLESVHDELTDLAGGALAVRRIDKKGLGLVDDGFEIVGGEGTLAAGQ